MSIWQATSNSKHGPPILLLIDAALNVFLRLLCSRLPSAPGASRKLFQIPQLDPEGGRRLAEEMGYVVPKFRRGCGQRVHDLYVGAGQETAGEYTGHRLSTTCLIRGVDYGERRRIFSTSCSGVQQRELD